jgi:hypothetical protein
MQLGVMLQPTPKFHAEFAVKGVECCWAHAKAFYRRMPVSRKRGQENFKQLVKECTSSSTALTKERIEKFASRARAYSCTYHHNVEQQKQQAAILAATDENSAVMSAPKRQELLYTEIERLSKAFKGHRCALDFDRGFVNSELKEAKEKDEGG